MPISSLLMILGSADCNRGGELGFGRRSPMPRPRIALLSNPNSTGNFAQLPRIRAFCAEHPDIFHYEVEHADQIGEAMKTIARVDPKLLVINGGDGTVQAALTELHNGGHFGDEAPPPVAVLPSGKTNLIALDLGVQGDPVAALERLLGDRPGRPQPAYRRARTDRFVARRKRFQAGHRHVPGRRRPCRYHALLPQPHLSARPAERHQPCITAVAVVLRQVFGVCAPASCRRNPRPLQIVHGAARRRDLGPLRFAVRDHAGKAAAVQRNRRARTRAAQVRRGRAAAGLDARAFFASLGGRLGRTKLDGVHIEEADEISIEGEDSQVILDGETFSAGIGKPILLRPAAPLSFVRLAA